MMKTSILIVAGLLALSLLLAATSRGLHGGEPPRDRDQLEALMKQGNFKEAYDGYRALCLAQDANPGQVGTSLRRAVLCLVRLGRIREIDAFREDVIALHKTNWGLLQAAAESYLGDVEHGGFLIAGKFERGPHRGGGQQVNAVERDRARALQLLAQGLGALHAEPDRPAVARYFLSLAACLLANRTGDRAWRLQSLTPLEGLPDYDPGFYQWGGESVGAPANADGSPVLYTVPQGFAQARSDGERWRWALAQAAEADAGQLNQTRFEQAVFWLAQFGTQTIAGMMLPKEGDEGKAGAASPYTLETLSDDETIARLATGVKRLTLPEEFNPIRIFQKIAREPQTGRGEDALAQLSEIFMNRRQLDRAAEYLKRSKEEYRNNTEWKESRLKQILGAWGQFETAMPQQAGRGATLDFRFRNGRKVQFEAHEIHVAKLLSDVKSYISSRPPQLDWQQLEINQIGARLVGLNQRQYVGRRVAQWDMELDPPKRHLDRRVTVSTPLQKAGAYLLTARMEQGNTSFIVVWLDDTVIVKKPVAGKAYYYVADARGGRPVSEAEVELFGWRMVQVEGKNEFRVETRELIRRSDAQGQVLVPDEELIDARGSFQWVCIARTAAGRLAHLGFSQIWKMGQHDPAYNQVHPFVMTDRPVYRPGQPVRFKFWVARARYDQPRASEFAGQSFAVEIHNPKGEKVLARSYQADAFGGFDGSLELPSDAALGSYHVLIPNMGGGSFRVEEYKKPEFEVLVESPARPVQLGEKVAASIRAKYYFGAPVSEAKVSYKITRRAAEERWYPAARWDWLFGPGYWWFASDSPWYPGWSSWGLERPSPSWWGRPEAPPEIVAQAELPIRPDGTLPVEIDTALAKRLHPDQDQRYEITVEVTDQSRRTIVGKGTVLVARRPFTVYTWVDRGHYRAGESIEAGIRASTLDRKPVSGKGTLKLLKIRYDAQGKPVETPVESWDVVLDAEGQARQTIKAAEPGQYRLSATIDDGQGHSIEGGYLLAITSSGFDGASFRFNDLEIVPDRKDYQPGDTLRLLINTNQVDSTVLLFVRPTNGVYPPPKVVRLRGKSTIEEVGVIPRDMPNFFVEALTVSGGGVYSETREIAVPPASRVVDVAVKPSAATYRPGQKARVKLVLKGPDGKPFTGSTVLTVYDKAVEYISGGSNVPEIRESFWKWKRSHHPQTESSLDHWSPNLSRPGEPGMEPLGIFSDVADEDRNLAAADGESRRKEFFGYGGRQGGMGGAGFQSKARASALREMAPAAPAAALARAAPGEGSERAAAEDFDAGLAPPGDKSGAAAGAGPDLKAPTVRTNFADTAFWAAALTPTAQGEVEVEFPLPESLTTWKVRTWTLGAGTTVGQGDAEFVTSKDLLLRLQAPRFFVEKDEVVLSANVHNKLKSKKNVQVVLETEGSVLQPLDASAQTVEIAAGSERRVDWRVSVAREGQAVVRMKALTDEESDAAQMTFPAYVHGMLKQEAVAGVIRPEQDRAQVTLRVPAERRPEQTRIEVRFSPTLAGALVDALPYLADYPYGCTEQTLNRFLPTVITQKVLLDMGLDLAAIRQKRTNLNAQELGDAQERARRWNSRSDEHNPVFDRSEVDRMAAAGIRRLADMQLSDGGWGWFSGFGEYASPHTTALVVHGLQLARRNDLALPEGVLERGTAWLAAHQAKQVQLLQNGVSEIKPFRKQADDHDALVFMVLTESGSRNDAMLGFLDRDRTHLSLYARAMFGLALEKLGDKDRLAMVLRNLRQYVVEDEENQTAYLKLPGDNPWWSWYGSEIETDAFYLKLLARTDPKGTLASRLVKYVLNNRRHGAYWNSTRDTAFCIEALADYLRASGEDRPEMTVSIGLDGQTRKEVRITRENLFGFDNSLVLEGPQVAAGERVVTFSKQGKGPLYFNAYLTNFTLEDPITRAGLEIKVDRRAYRLVRDDRTAEAAGDRGQVVGERRERYRREPLADGDSLKSGDLVEVELEIESKNDYEYLVFEDFKAAGFEPVEVRSGYNGNALNAYVEFRDNRVAFFSRTLARGRHSVSYRLRAEIPGRFHALPARAQAMYAPELKANSDEIRLKVED